MKQTVNDYLTPPPPVDPQDYRVLQRVALQEYFHLLPENTGPVVECIEQQAEQQRHDIEERFEQEVRVAHLCHDPEIEKLEREHQSQVQAIEAQCRQEQAAIEQHTQHQRQALEQQTQRLLQQAHKRYEEQCMVADFVAGGIEEKCDAEQRRLKDWVDKATGEMSRLQEQALLTIRRYRLPTVEPRPQSPDEASGENLEKLFQHDYDLADQILGRLQRNKSAALLMGWRGWVCLTGLLILAELVVILRSVADPFSTLSLGMIGGITAAAVVGIGIPLLWVLKKTCRRSLHRQHLQYEQQIQKAQQNLSAFARWKQEQLTQQRQAGQETQARELEKARWDLDQCKAATQQQTEQSLERLSVEQQKAKEQLQQRKTTTLSQARQRFEENHARLTQQRAEELTEIQSRLDHDLTEINEQKQALRTQLENRWDQALTLLKTLSDQTTALDPVLMQPLESLSLEEWTIPEISSTLIGFGYFSLDLQALHPQVLARDREVLARIDPHLNLPALLGLPVQGSLLLQTERSGRERALEVLRVVVSRLFIAMVPGQVRFTLIDPVGLGETFAGFMHAGDYLEALVGGRIWTEQIHIQQQLENLTQHIETVIQKYLRNEFETIEQYNAQAGELAEPYRYLVIADFPLQFNEESARRLTSILQSGPRCGVHTLIVYDRRQELPPGFDLEDIRNNSIYLLDQEGNIIWQDPVYRRFKLQLEHPLSEQKLTEMMRRIGQAGMESARVEVPFTSIAPASEQQWSQDSREELSVALGRSGATRRQHLRMGKGMSQHMLIAGKTGSGKSTLFHVLITNTALWYRPDEVQMYLIDFKKGVEFKTYVTHQVPHIRAVAIESDREFGLSILQRLDAELTRRGELFRQAGVQDITAFRNQTRKKMPRTLLIVDEFQVFFAEDDKIAQDATVLLEQLVRQGRAFGVHVILGSQTLGGAFGLARSTMGQMAIRLALQCSEADSQLILDDDNIAARHLNRPGEAIYNDAGGQIAGNSPFQVAWLPDAVRDHYLDGLPPLSEDQPLDPMIVFEGSEPADIRENTLLLQYLSQEIEITPNHQPSLWLGAPLAIKAPTSITLRRQSGAHLLIVGQREEMAMQLISAAWLSLAAQSPSQRARFIVLDGCSADSDFSKCLPALAGLIPHEKILVQWRQVEDTLAQLVQELRHRLTQDHPDPCSIYLIIFGLQRYRVLRRSVDSFGFSLDNEGPASTDANLAEILREGPAVGIHVLTWVDTLATLERALERSTLREFDHRVLMQMSSNDSSNLIDSTAANQLGFHRALLYSEEQGGIEKFRSYTPLDMDWLKEICHWK